jgi:chromosome segregation protein
MKALEDYENVSQRQAELQEKINTLTTEREQILQRMQGYEDLKKETFLRTYNALNENFKDIFHKLSEGEGTLVLENEEKPFEGGLDIEAQPRDKKKQRLMGMSGGEKALTALSFVFAIQKYMPAPFYAFDEVDASLDSINVEKLANIVQSQSDSTQFIVVSHRKPMIESADRTIGVTQKEKGISKVTGVKLRD